MPFVLPDLPYAKDALDPHMSAETFEYHWGKHHKKYVDETNRLATETGKQGLSLLEFIAQADKGPQFNNSAQLWNHSFFWQCLGPNGGKPSGELAARIDSDLGGYEQFSKDFAAEATKHFASGWAWLVEQDGKLAITSYHDADTPVTHGVKPLFTLDVWEHAYYIDYRNERPKFIEAVLGNIVNWDFVAQNLDGQGASRADQPGS